MGQYFLILNLDKKEYLHPHKLGSGYKLWEIGLYDLAKRFFKDISEEVKWDFNDFIGIEEMKVYASYEERLAVRLGKPDKR